jgi:uncharacterized protein
VLLEGDKIVDRLEKIREIVDEILRNQPDEIEGRCGFVHLYGVAAICSMLAIKRGLDVEIGTISGMLHDIASYKTGDPVNHAERGAVEARIILEELDLFSDQEIEIICTAIANHSKKEDIHDAYSELLKDSDVLQHHLYNTSFKVIERELVRLNSLFEELGMYK